MQTTFKLFFSCLFCLALLLSNGCGGAGGGVLTESVPTLTPAEQAEVDKLLAEEGTNAILVYIMSTEHRDKTGAKLKYLQWFVSQGADVNAKGDGGETPLHWVANVEIAKFLVSKGADVNAKDERGGTPLDRTNSWGRNAEKKTEVVEYLKSVGAKRGRDL